MTLLARNMARAKRRAEAERLMAIEAERARTRELVSVAEERLLIHVLAGLVFVTVGLAAIGLLVAAFDWGL